MSQFLEKRISEVVEADVKKLGFNLLQVRIKGTTPTILEVFIERNDNHKVSVNDCQLVSKHISVMIDVESIIQGKYYLEVSSSGAERPIVRFEDYNKFINHEVKIKLKKLFNGKRNYYGRITDAKDSQVHLDCDMNQVIIPFDLIQSSHLVFLDSRYKKLLKK